MPYTIEIKQTKQIDSITRREWVQGGSDAKSEDSGWGYTPQIPEKRNETVTVYTQVVDDMNLVSVINAVNAPSDSITRVTK